MSLLILFAPYIPIIVIYYVVFLITIPSCLWLLIFSKFILQQIQFTKFVSNNKSDGKIWSIIKMNKKNYYKDNMNWIVNSNLFNLNKNALIISVF